MLIVGPPKQFVLGRVVRLENGNQALTGVGRAVGLAGQFEVS